MTMKDKFGRLRDFANECEEKITAFDAAEVGVLPREILDEINRGSNFEA